MNKQELIEKYKSALNKVHKVYGDYYKTEAYEEVLKDLKQLDEPQKVTVPQFVADWIEYCKNTNVTLTRALMIKEVDFYNYANQEDHFRLVDFLESEINQEKFARAWLDGYEVEKEKRYIVKVKGAEEGYNYLNCRISLNEYFFS
jgi:hypothetical protein|nr:MAG TPA: Protein of unknown function (DUF1642) [Caudoviricetes sp.]